MHDPVLIFQLYPLTIFYLAFLEGIEWVRANSDGGEHDKARHAAGTGNHLH
jgi:hypothetical protein